MRRILGCLGTVLALGCGAPCKARSVAATGDLGRDVVGTWGAFGIDSEVVATFAADGGFWLTEVGGLVRPEAGSWSVDGGTLTAVSDGELREGPAALVGDALSWNDRRLHGAVSCPGVVP